MNPLKVTEVTLRIFQEERLFFASRILHKALDFEIDLNVTTIKTLQEAKKAPSGYGVFNLLNDGKL